MFRVISGIVLDLKVFRSVRPQIYNGVTFLQGIIAALFPLMTSYSEFMLLSAIDGVVQGTKLAQVNSIRRYTTCMHFLHNLLSNFERKKNEKKLGIVNLKLIVNLENNT